MKISTILDHIDSGHMALPEFQRGYVWNRDQVRGLMRSLYRRYPVGGLLVWATHSEGARHRGEGELAPGVVKLLLDGQQRITSLYGIVRGRAPRFFDGNEQAFTGLHFHLESEDFAFYSPIQMRDDPAWINVSELMAGGLGAQLSRVVDRRGPALDTYLARLTALHGIPEVDLHVDEVTGEDKTIDVVVDIFNRVNSGGTKLSKGDLALAKICAEAPDARERMKQVLARWREAGYGFSLDWLLRNVNTVTTGTAKFSAMHELSAEQFDDGLRRAEKAVDHLLNSISGRLGLDHDRVLFGRYALPVLAHYVDRRGGAIRDASERDQALFWYLESAMWGRFSGSTETLLDRDLEVLEDTEGGLDRLIRELRLWRGGLRVQPDHFSGWSVGARFYPVLYLLTRVGEARDWGNGLPLKRNLLGRLSQLEVHHIFPKALLYRTDYRRREVNAVANFCFLTKETNLRISDRSPSEYFPEIERCQPGALASQWIPMDPELWRVERYRDFLEERKKLLADAANRFLAELHGEELRYEGPEAVRPAPAVGSGVESAEEEAALLECRDWVAERGLSEGEYLFELVDEESGRPLAILDLAWPHGLQEELSVPVALLLNEPAEVLEVAQSQGYRCFTSIDAFKRYVGSEILCAEPRTSD